MRHEDRIKELIELHELMLKRIAGHDPAKLPSGVDIGKLEHAYDSLKGYTLVLRKA